MIEYKSRSEKRRDNILAAAKKGKFSVIEWLYKSEIRRLYNDGFRIISQPSTKPNLWISSITWENAEEGTPAYEFYSIALAVK